MTEEFLYYLWEKRLLATSLKTAENQSLEIISPGYRNIDSGPDFLYARVKIGDTEWAGNVEIHVKASDWHRHRHSQDKAYDNVILHVVYENDRPVILRNNYKLPVLELKGKFDEKLYSNYQWLVNSPGNIACANQIAAVHEMEKLFWLERLMADRLEEKSLEIEQELQQANDGFQEVFYRKMSAGFGFKVNKNAFEVLAGALPLKVIQKHADNRMSIEALLYGVAGLLQGSFKDDYPNTLKKEFTFLSQKYDLKPMEPVWWKFMRMRPGNFPTIRISQWAALLFKLGAQFQKIPEIKRLSDVEELFSVRASSYWDEHYRFDVLSKNKKKMLGIASGNVLIINGIIPFVFVYGKLFGVQEYRDKALSWLEQIKAENNKVVRQYKKLGFPVKNAMHSQALLHLKKHYCDRKLCLECALGQKIIKR